MSTDGQGTKWHRNITENFNRLSRVHERYRRQTDDRRQTDGRRHIANVNVSSLKTTVSFYRMVQSIFRYVELFRRDLQCDRQTDRQEFSQQMLPSTRPTLCGYNRLK